MKKWGMGNGERCTLVMLALATIPLSPLPVFAQRPTYQQQVQDNQHRLEGIRRERSVVEQDALLEKRAVLERRLVDIYKRGALYSWQVLLAAESFGDLLSPTNISI